MNGGDDESEDVQRARREAIEEHGKLVAYSEGKYWACIERSA